MKNFIKHFFIFFYEDKPPPLKSSFAFIFAFEFTLRYLLAYLYHEYKEGIL